MVLLHLIQKIRVEFLRLVYLLNFIYLDTNWKQVQRTISNNEYYEIIFEYESITSEYNYIAIDDISIINGACSMYLKTNVNIILFFVHSTKEN
jgi:hypothetical protein